MMKVAIEALLVLIVLACMTLAFLIKEKKKVQFLKDYWNYIFHGFGLLLIGRVFDLLDEFYAHNVFDFFDETLSTLGFIVVIVGLVGIRSNAEVLILKKTRLSITKFHYPTILLLTILFLGLGLVIALGNLESEIYRSFTQEAIILGVYLVMTFTALRIKELKQGKGWNMVVIGASFGNLGALLDIGDEFASIAFLDLGSKLLLLFGSIFLVVGLYYLLKEDH